jgi:hypothetical protein
MSGACRRRKEKAVLPAALVDQAQSYKLRLGITKSDR